MPGYVKVNINDMVKFKPTEFGLRVLMERYWKKQEWLDRCVPRGIGVNAKMPAPDEDGWYS